MKDHSLIYAYPQVWFACIVVEIKREEKTEERVFCQPTAPVYSSVFHPKPKSHLLFSLSLTHLPKVDTLTPSAGAVHVP